MLISFFTKKSVSGKQLIVAVVIGREPWMDQHVDNHRHGEREESAADGWSRWSGVGAADEPDDDRDAPLGFEGAPQLDRPR